MDIKILQNIKENYSLKDIISINLLRDGIDNIIYQITDSVGEKIIIRLSKRGVSDHIKFETDLIRYLNECHVPVPRILTTKLGDGYILIGDAVIVLFCFIKGVVLKITPNRKPPIEMAKDAGTSLGMLHKYSVSLHNKTGSINRTIFTEYERALNKKENIFKLDGGKQFIQTLDSYQKWAMNYEGPKGIIHNDYIPSNLIKTTDGVVIIDFDWACYAPVIKDLGLALATWSRPDGLDEHWKDVFSAFIEGYNELAPESVKVTRDLYMWICFSCLSDACTFFADLSDDDVRIKSVMQCRRYKTFLYFSKFI